ncbi:DUF1893 domain-containing protein [Anaerotignum sp. MB30-C6]|uniref:DUF1893 domain-containing protein n=1 Tax=Anaerotignum sp. MB30-C6 TaxID=3070814 RepID=UPI0027DDDD42|nr:DUF1893 domain-containing protein [Anaerotignum sp. MB30-C6]WMI80751.1 DUF1893 domain-containing protein [Anaerotignum sp. MB30-C6]
MLQKEEQARAALAGEGVTFAAVSTQGELRTSTQKGIAPIMEILKSEAQFLEGAYVADKVIGKAAALLLVKGKISHLYAGVMSAHAAEALKENNIPFEYGKSVPYIINRRKDGMCPMEATVLEETNVEEAYLKLQNKLAELRGSK